MAILNSCLRWVIERRKYKPMGHYLSEQKLKLKVSIQPKFLLELVKDRIFFGQVFKFVLIGIGYFFGLVLLHNTDQLDGIVV